MRAPTSMSSSLTVAVRSGKAAWAPPAPKSWRAALAVAALGAAALVAVWAGASWEEPTGSLSRDVRAFQQRVAAPSPASSDAAAAEVLAHRYRDTLAPDVRRRIAEQVRAEQRAGRTADGNHAFVMRRLALYEDALQQATTVAQAHEGASAVAR